MEGRNYTCILLEEQKAESKLSFCCKNRRQKLNFHSVGGTEGRKETTFQFSVGWKEGCVRCGWSLWWPHLLQSWGKGKALVIQHWNHQLKPNSSLFRKNRFKWGHYWPPGCNRVNMTWRADLVKWYIIGTVCSNPTHFCTKHIGLIWFNIHLTCQHK